MHLNNDSVLSRKAAEVMASEQDPRWTAIINRDPAYDGVFVYAVKTTGVYCRPTCAARLANVENVAFYDNPAAAEKAGFRPCKRCKPDGIAPATEQAALVAAACRQITAAETLPSLATLAKTAGLSPYHFHRLFKSITGLTPKAYGMAARSEKMRAALEAGAGSVTAAIYEAGFNSNSRFYESSKAVLGMTPSAYRAGGVDTEIRFAIGASSLGAILVAQSAQGVCAILMGDDPEMLARDLQNKFPKAVLVGGDADFETMVARVVGFVEAPGLGLNLPLDIRGTAFQQRVWQALQAIPAGATASYADIARAIGTPKAVRAVAGACAANMIAVAIPCHRVVRTDGALSGYRWGVARKQALLDREAGV